MPNEEFADALPDNDVDLDHLQSLIEESGVMNAVEEDDDREKEQQEAGGEAEVDEGEEDLAAEAETEESEAHADIDEEPDEVEETGDTHDEQTITLLDDKGEKINMTVDELLEKTEHEVKVNGEVQKVDYQELVSGYQKQQDYIQKTTELAKEREELTPYAQMVAFAKTDPDFVQYVGQYIQNGGIPQDLAASARLEVSDEQLTEMMDDDPHAAREIMTARSQLNKKMYERRQVNETATLEARQQLEAWAKHEDAKSAELIPDFDKGKSDTYLKEIGFTDEEVSVPRDHRMQMVIAEASKYREMIKEKTTPTKAKASLKSKRKSPLPPRAMRSGTGKSQPLKKKVQKANINKATQTQKDEDWLKVLEDRLT